FEPGAIIPFTETHVMEHGLYVLEGKAVYRLNRDWVEVEAGDYMWLRAFCPQACYAGGPGRFRYLLYKDANRHMDLSLFSRRGRAGTLRTHAGPPRFHGHAGFRGADADRERRPRPRDRSSVYARAQAGRPWHGRESQSGGTRGAPARPAGADAAHAAHR